MTTAHGGAFHANSAMNAAAATQNALTEMIPP